MQSQISKNKSKKKVSNLKLRKRKRLRVKWNCDKHSSRWVGTNKYHIINSKQWHLMHLFSESIDELVKDIKGKTNEEIEEKHKELKGILIKQFEGIFYCFFMNIYCITNQNN